MLDSHVGDIGQGRVDQGAVTSSDEQVSSDRAGIRLDMSNGIRLRQFDDLELMVVSKHVAGFTAPQAQVLTKLVRDIASGRAGPCKFLVFDLASPGEPGAKPPPQFEALVEDLSNLIFQVPVISIAWARHDVSGPDLELGLACSMLVGEAEARFAFDLDLVDSLRAYALLSQKIGFVQAERLMEAGAVLSAEAAHDLMILHSVMPSGEGFEGIRRFVSSRTRRHNATCGLYRAQRIARPGAT